MVAGNCYRFDFGPWRSARPRFMLDTLPRTFQLTTQRVSTTYRVTEYRARQVSGPTFGDHAPEVPPVWHSFAGDPPGFGVYIHDFFYGASLQVYGQGAELSGEAVLSSDDLYPDSSGTLSVVVAEAAITATLVPCLDSPGRAPSP